MTTAEERTLPIDGLCDAAEAGHQQHPATQNGQPLWCLDDCPACALEALDFASDEGGIARARQYAALLRAATDLWALADSSSYVGDWADELDALEKAVEEIGA